MSEKCNCFEETLEELKTEMMKKIPENATDVEFSWENEALFFSGDRVPVNPRVNITYRKMKTDNTPFKSLSKENVSILCSYCPFCGRKLKEE